MGGQNRRVPFVLVAIYLNWLSGGTILTEIVAILFFRKVDLPLHL